MKSIPNGQFLPPKLFAQILLVMRLTVLLLTLGFLHVSAHGFSQEKITLNVKNMTLDDVFKEITKQSGYYFWSGSNMPELNDKVDVAIKNGSIQEVMDQCLSGLGLTYTVSDKMVFIKERAVVKEAEVIANGVDVKGKVTDENGEPLSGATIAIEGTKFVIAANDKGEFLIKNMDPDATVKISSIGYEPQVLTHFGRRNVFNFSLKQKVGILDETQIIAYGTATQRYSVGSITKVSADQIALQPVSNPLAALEGQVPGLVITQSSGVPGASFSAQIRGQNSLGSSVEPVGEVPLDNPLFIIDGVPFAPQNGNVNQFTSLAAPGGQLVYNNYNGGISPFNSINPADIESIEVLRDADATAIYGSRGANGVIIITTKKGKAGKTTFNANIYDGESHVTRTMPMMDITQYLIMRHEALANDGSTPGPYDVDVDGTFDTTRNADWRKQFLEGMARSTDANLSISGGTANTQILIGGGYHNESYITPGNFSDKRGSINVNVRHHSLDNRLSLEFVANYSYDVNNSSGQPSALLAFTLPPNYPALLDQNNNLVWEYNGVDLGNYFGNPLAYLKQKYTDQTYNLISNLQVGYKLLPGLTIQSSFGYNSFNNQETSIVPLASLDPSMNPISSAQYGSGLFGTWIVEPQAVFKKTIAQGRLDILIGGTFEKNTSSQTSIDGSNYTNDALLGSIDDAGSKTAQGVSSLYKYEGVFGRVNYIWREKYLLDITARRDGSSRFGPGRQFGDFGSVGGGWIFSQEKYIRESLPFLSFGKVRATYGTSGNDNIGNYQYLSAWSPLYSATYQGQAGYVPLNLFNPNFSWDLNKKLEGGLELGFIKDRLFLNTSWYRNRCGDQLVAYRLPEQTGFRSVTQNAPYTVQNMGWEFQLNSTNVKNKTFSWTMSINLTIPKNKLLAFPGLSSSPYSSEYIVGKSLSTVQGFKLLGVNDTTGVYQFATSKGPTYNPSYPSGGSKGDYQVFGNLDPKFFGGISNQFSYKGFQLNIVAQFVKQTGASFLGQVYQNALPGNIGNEPVAVLGRWQKPGDKSNIEQFSEEYGGPAFNAAAYYINSDAEHTDASFIRIKTIAVSYNFPASMLKNIKIQGCRIFLNGQNLLTITGYRGSDPESQSLYGIPPLKTVVGGINFTL